MSRNHPARSSFRIRKRTGKNYGVPSESCSGDNLSLERFSKHPKVYDRELKSPHEQILNPFGDAWESRTASNRYIPLMTSSNRKFVGKKIPALDQLLESDEPILSNEAANYLNYLSRSPSPYHYDESLGQLCPDMPEFRAFRKALTKLGVEKKFIGYTVINFDSRTLFPQEGELAEKAYLHYPETSRCPGDRLHFKDHSTLDASGYVFDIRHQYTRDAIAERIVHCMIRNKLDCVLIDYAVRPYAFGMPVLADKVPEDWDLDFQEHQYNLVKTIYSKAKLASKEIFLNGVMLDGIVVTDPTLVRLFSKVSDALFWEQPFRWEWRGYHDGEYDYYQRLEEFFTTTLKIKKKLIIKIGTYRFHATEDLEPSWNARFKNTDQGIERHLVEYFTSFYLLFANRHYNPIMYTHPIEIYDIFCSEAYFGFWNTNTGEPVGQRMEISQHVQMRVFENGIIFLNNNLEQVTLDRKMLNHLAKVTPKELILAPLSGLFWQFPIRRHIQLFRLLGSIVKPRTRLNRMIDWLRG